MARALGLARDPFAPVSDGDLYWEDRPRADIRRRAAESLLSGRGVWLSGPPGSGRTALLDRLADDLEAQGQPVLRLDAPVAGSPEGLLGSLLDVAGGRADAEGLLPAARALYGRLLEAFCAAGPVACFPGPLSARPDVVAEVEILAGLRLAGCGLVGVALAGGGESPVPGLETLRLPAPSAEDVRSMLSQRLSACGGVGLLSARALDRVAEGAAGFDRALALARRELWRLAFERCLSPADTAQPSPSPSPPPPSLFDSAQLEELSELLASLGPGKP